MQVKLISIPDNLINIIYLACKTCYSNNIDENIGNDEKLKLIKKVLSSGHYSTIEHIQVTFSISGITRSTSHQLVRHRHASYSQKSQRYINESKFEYVIPEAIKEQDALKNKYENLMQLISNFYNDLVENNIKKEDARSILPNACTTSLIMSLNLRELIHIANLRLCTRAQSEIRQLVKKMCDLITEKEPWLSDYLVPKCVSLGYCNEHNSCGKVKMK